MDAVPSNGATQEVRLSADHDPKSERRRTERFCGTVDSLTVVSDEQRRRTEASPTDTSSDESEANASDAEPESTGALGTPGIIQPIEFAPDGVPKHVAVAFWTVVVVVNAAILALSLGPLLIFFRGQWLLGGGLFVLGVALSGLAYWRYRQFRREQAERAEAEDENEDDEDDEESVFSVVPERGLPGLDDRAGPRESGSKDVSDSTQNR